MLIRNLCSGVYDSVLSITVAASIAAEKVLRTRPEQQCSHPAEHITASIVAHSGEGNNTILKQSKVQQMRGSCG
jgi:hypothetical protein